MKAASSLRELNIRSLGVIDSAEIEFHPGLTVLTGETGAGKTMVLTALGLILGAKSDSDFVRHGADRLSVTARFEIAGDLAQRAIALGGEVEDGELLVTRQVTEQGKSKVLLGGVPSTASAIAELGNDLVEIHGQSTSGRITKSAVVRDLLDSYGNLHNFLFEYEEIYRRYGDLAKRISDLRSLLSVKDREIAILEEFLKEYDKVSPQENEIFDIENEISRLGSVETISGEVTSALTNLSDEEFSALNALGSARKSLESIRGKDSDLDLIIDRYLDSQYAVQESASELSRYLANLEANPARFEYLQNRKAELASLLKRFGKGSDRQIAYQLILEEGEGAKARLQDLRGGDAQIEKLEEELKEVFLSLRKSALTLTQERERASARLADSITKELAALSMPHAQVFIEVSPSDPEKPSSYTASGLDDLRILFRSHSGSDFLPIGKSASGGELSRVMLAVEVSLAGSKSIGTYIFDEVDAGVGGKAAIEVGRRLALLAKNAQVIVVTHLAQVAVWADTHIVVEKSEDGAVVRSGLRAVTGEARQIEVARLLSGQEESSSAREHATELLNMVSHSMIG